MDGRYFEGELGETRMDAHPMIDNKFFNADVGDVLECTKRYSSDFKFVTVVGRISEKHVVVMLHAGNKLTFEIVTSTKWSTSGWKKVYTSHGCEI